MTSTSYAPRTRLDCYILSLSVDLTSPCAPYTLNELLSLIAFDLKLDFDLNAVSAVPAREAPTVHSLGIRQPHVWNEYLEGVHRVDLVQPD